MIALLGESGQVAAEDLQRFTETALRMERDVGVAVADTVKAYVELGEKRDSHVGPFNEKSPLARAGGCPVGRRWP